MSLLNRINKNTSFCFAFFSKKQQKKLRKQIADECHEVDSSLSTDDEDKGGPSKGKRALRDDESLAKKAKKKKKPLKGSEEEEDVEDGDDGSKKKKKKKKKKAMKSKQRKSSESSLSVSMV